MRHIMTRLVNKAVERSQLLRVDKLKMKSAWQADIAISRDPGSGGKVIAKKIASKLGWQLFDKNLMAKLSTELQIPANELVNIDEHGRTWIIDLFNSIFNPDYVSDLRYILQLKKLLIHYENLNTREEAAAQVLRFESNRNRFIHQYFGVNPHNPWLYDLVICTDHLSIDQATSIIIHAFHAKFPKAKKSLSSTSAEERT